MKNTKESFIANLSDENIQTIMECPDKDFKKVQKLLKSKGYLIKRGKTPKPSLIYFSSNEI